LAAEKSFLRPQRPPDLEAVPYQTRLAFLLGAISNLTTATGSRLFRRAFGLGLGEVRLMYVLNYEGPLTARQASRIIGVDKGAMSRTVAALEHRGIVRTRIDDVDARQRVIDFTPDGRRLVERVMVLALQREKQLYSILTNDELIVLSSLLQKLRSHLLAVRKPELEQIRDAGRPPVKPKGRRATSNMERTSRRSSS
jgi:DNA-binding MarR family transcriptional regulator